MEKIPSLPSVRATRRRGRWRAAIGIGLTLLYLAAAFVLLLSARTNVLELKPNEVAEMLGSIFGPLALLWVILGYLQQGEELEHSTAALQQQAEELRLSVEQQRQLVEVTRDQVASERRALEEERQERSRAAQPIFDVPNVQAVLREGGDLHVYLAIVNVGQSITSVRVYIPGGQLTVQNAVRSSWERNEELKFTAIGSAVTSFNVELSYLDALLMRHGQQFAVNLIDPRPGGPSQTIFNVHVLDVIPIRSDGK